MSWFTRKPQGTQPASLKLETGPRPSRGIELLCEMVAEQKLHGVLDLGASSTENARFLARFSDDVFIHDLFRSASGEAGARSKVFQFDTSAASLLPEGKAKYDLILLWDLIQFFDRASFEPFDRRLAELCRPGALVFLLAANHAPQPLTPIHFKILAGNILDYTIPPGEFGESPRLTTREVEHRMSHFRPIRLFQLRNGMQEFLFRYESKAVEGIESVAKTEKSGKPDRSDKSEKPEKGMGTDP